jgi:Lecithin:cholesterol acyltransferase
MKLFVWVPGILGSRLERRADGAEIWPPSPTAVDGLDDRTYAQLTDDLIATKVIDAVCVVPIYSPLDQLFVRAGINDYDPSTPADMVRLPFGYDWRLGIETQASLLADRLDAATKDGDEIVFLAHSMGNYICRYLIETDVYAGRSFRGRVRQLVSVNGPHAGAPVIIARMMGLDKMDHIVWADVPRVLACAPFAAPCELLPAPGRNHLFNGANPINLYDAATVAHFGWGAANIAQASQFWGRIGAQKRADGVEYVIVRSYLDEDGEGQSTIAGVSWDGAAWTVQKGPGDGAVPPWSAEALGKADVTLPGEHLGVFDTDAFATEVFQLYIAPLPEGDAQGLQPTLKLQPLRRDAPAGGQASFALIQDMSNPADRFDGYLVWCPLTPTGAIDMTQQRLKDPLTIDDLKEATVVQVQVPNQPGPYLVVLTGAIDDDDMETNPSAGVVVTPVIPANPPPPPPA